MSGVELSRLIVRSESMNPVRDTIIFLVAILFNNQLVAK